MFTLIKKELRQYFSGLLGYITIGVFLLASSIYLFFLPGSNILDAGYASIDSFFEFAPLLLLFLIPAITMRSLSEEYRNGTFEVLSVSPIRKFELIFSKFISSLLVAILSILFTAVYIISISSLSTGGIDFGAIVGSYFGLFLLCAVYSAIGIFTSSMQENSVISFLLSALLCYIAYSFFGSLADLSFLQSGLGYYISLIGIQIHYKNISKGFIDLRDVVYFLSVVLFFLLLAIEKVKSKYHKKQSTSTNSIKLFALVVFLLLINVPVNYFHLGLDLTKEKRFTISDQTKKLISSIDESMTLTVYLKGDMPAGFKRLGNSVEDIANAFKSFSGGKFNVVFEKPGEGLADTTKAILFDSLQAIGINPTNVKAQIKKGEQSQETLVFPGAILSSNGKQIGIDFLEGQSNLNGLASLNNAEALLEFKIAKAIVKINQEKLQQIGYLIGNGEPVDMHIYDLVERILRKDYSFKIVPIDSVEFIPTSFDALIVARPTQSFSVEQKLKLDQYVMHGGKMLWAIDNLYASMDSLQRSSGSFVAFDMNLDLEDQFFRYGVRINKDLVQDLECDKVPSVIGSIGDKPQIELLPWPYAPLLRNNVGHPISKNLDYVLSAFPQSIDTISTNGITHQLLLSTSDFSRSLQTPAIVEWKSIKTEEDLNYFTKKQIPVAVLVEGKFNSLFSNRLTAAQLIELQDNQGGGFVSSCQLPNSMIFISDADILLNTVSESDGPLPMGINSYTREQFANKDFISNSLFYLTGGAGIMSTRSKAYQLRLLDKELLERDRLFWQLLNILLPLVFPLLLSIGYPFLRKRRFAHQA